MTRFPVRPSFCLTRSFLFKEGAGRAGAPLGMKFKNRRQTGEIVPADAPGRDPIVTRILWLRGLQAQNRQAFDRGIYIHGTAAEHDIGRPRSYGCIRMRSKDVVRLFNTVGVGARVEVVPASLQSAIAKTDEAPKGDEVSKPGVVQKGENIEKTTEAQKAGRPAKKPHVTKAARVAQR